MPTNHRKLISNESGSISVMIALLIPVMLLMLMLIVNINQLFFQKIRLQNTVDACALSAAAVQAAGLNEIADLNWDMEKEHRKIRKILNSSPFPWHNKRHAIRAKQYFSNKSTGVLDYIDNYQKTANVDYAVMAEAVAQKVKRMNLPQSTLISNNRQGELASFILEKRPCNYQFYTMPEMSVLPARNLTKKWFKPSGFRGIKGLHDGSITVMAKRIGRMSGRFTIPYQKHKTSRVEADYEIFLPPQNVLLANSIFKGIPRLHARARAKPAGGTVGGRRPTYTSVLVD